MNFPWKKKAPKSGLLVKDLLTELEQAVDVKQRIQEVRSAGPPAPGTSGTTDIALLNAQAAAQAAAMTNAQLTAGAMAPGQVIPYSNNVYWISH